MNNNYLSTLLTLVFCLSFANNSFAQTPVQLSIGSATISQGQSACLPVTVNNFTEIVTMQWSLRWNPALVEYIDVDFGSNPLGLNATHFNIPNDSTFRMSWLEPNNQLITLAGEQVLLSVCFNAIGSGTTAVAFEQDIPTEFIGDQFMEVPANTMDGEIIVPAGPALISILPGDTNNDSIVNADDLLNIGLAFGANGPARSPASTNFNFESSLPWGQSTPQSNVDFAMVNADGNTTINELDQAVVELNFGQQIFGAVGGPQYPFNEGAAIRFEAEPAESEGLMTLALFIGEEAMPVEPGYGISLSVELDPELFDLDNFSFSTIGNALGSDLLLLVEASTVTPGLIEIAMVRKDQENSMMTGGFLGNLNVLTRSVIQDTETIVTINTIRYIDRDENTLGGVSTTAEASILAPVSILEPSWAESIKIGPNPVIGERFSINGVLANKVAKLTLVDLNNRILGTYPAETRSIDVSGLAPGVYYLQIEAKNMATLLTRKIIVQ